MVVVVRNFVEDRVGFLGRFSRDYRRFNVNCFVMVFVVRPFYIMFVVVCDTVGALHRSRVVSRRGAIAIWRVVVSTCYRYVCWGRNSF